MSKQGIAGYEHKELLKSLWESGLRAKGIVKYLKENDLPPVSENALAKYGQRNWNNKVVKEVEAPTSFLEEAIEEYGELGNIERISVSKTGFNISIKPKVAIDSEDDIKKLPRASVEVSKGNKKKSDVATHVIIPDTQIESGRSSEHLRWMSNYCKDNVTAENVKVIHLGDHWNMGSLSSYDQGKGKMEGRRYLDDIKSGNEAFKKIDLPTAWLKYFLLGNHENRVNKATNNNIQLDGLLTTDHMLTPGWERHDFLEVLELDGIAYSHYFYNPNTSKPYGGENLDTRLKIIGRSFVMGHQQGLKFAQRYINNKQQIGIVAGSFYEHQEEYMGPQGQGYWRGIVILHDVHDGSCESPEFVSIDRLREYA